MDMQELKQLISQGEKVNLECKKAESTVPRSVYESYSAFANTNGGYIILGVLEDKTKKIPEERFIIQGVQNPEKQKEDFWNTINGSKVGFGDNAGSGFPSILAAWKEEGWIEPELIENINLNQVTLVLKMVMDKSENVTENVAENVTEITEKRLRRLIPEYSKKKATKAAKIVKMISENPRISIDEMRTELDVTHRTIARYISELKKYKVIGRVGPDHGGLWKILKK